MPSAQRILGVIPARGGSKGVVRKNVRLVAGRPLIAHTIEVAAHSRLLTDAVVSTDDAQIAEAAVAAGGEVLMRPGVLAADDTPMIPVIDHALDSLEPARGRYDYVVVLQPTAPMRWAEDIDNAITILLETGADSVVGVYEVSDAHPARMYRFVDGRLVPYEAESAERLRQKLPAVYHRNGAVYACRRALIAEERTLLGPDTRPYIMPRERSINIDDELDLAVADFLMARLRKKDASDAPHT